MARVEVDEWLIAQGVSKNYGGVRALIESDFSCKKGEVHALLGENGAGKSTLVKILCGVVKPDSGVIKLKGKEIAIDSPMDANRHGIAAVFQELSLVPDLSIAENIYLGHEPKNKLGFIDFNKMNKMAETLLMNLGFQMEPQELVRDLPLAQQQLAEIAKALSKEPEIVIFDEATSALGNQEVEMLFAVIKKLREQGKTCIFISHRMDELEKIVDRATVFRDAQYIATFEWGKVGNNQIVNWIAGRNLQETFPPKKAELDGRIALEVRNLTAGRALRQINLTLHKGEILGIAGLQGHGQSEFLRVLFGAYPMSEGEIRIFDQPVRITSPIAALKAGIAFVPEDRKTEGLLLPVSIKENIALMTLNKRQVLGIISSNQENQAVQRITELLSIKASNASQAVGHLSGGNQQKVVIGKAVLSQSKILLLADPTRGIDVGTKAEIYKLVGRLADEGITILLYSTELPELVGLCHRVAVFKQGRINAILCGDEVNEHEIIHASLGMA